MLDWALALGAAAGQLQAAMRVVADIERRLARLASDLDLDRQTATIGGRPLPTVAIVTSLGTDELVLAGGWVPGLAAAAGTRAVGAVEGGPDVRLGASGLAALSPDAVVLALAGRSLNAAAALRAEVEVGGWRGPSHVIDGTRFINQPVPTLVRSIELIAYLMHGEHAGVSPEPGEAIPWNAGPPE